jgi:hypothetical protein
VQRVILAGSLAIGLSAIAQPHNHLHLELSEGVGIGLLIAGGIPVVIFSSSALREISSSEQCSSGYVSRPIRKDHHAHSRNRPKRSTEEKNKTGHPTPDQLRVELFTDE